MQYVSSTFRGLLWLGMVWYGLLWFGLVGVNVASWWRSMLLALSITLLKTVTRCLCLLIIMLYSVLYTKKANYSTNHTSENSHQMSLPAYHNTVRAERK